MNIFEKLHFCPHYEGENIAIAKGKNELITSFKQALKTLIYAYRSHKNRG